MGKLALGIELGSTRIKAVAIDENNRIVSSGDYTWKSDLKDGVWTYPMEKVWEGLNQAVSGIRDREEIGCAAVSAMMHGYLPFGGGRAFRPIRGEYSPALEHRPPVSGGAERGRARGPHRPYHDPGRLCPARPDRRQRGGRGGGLRHFPH